MSASSAIGLVLRPTFNRKRGFWFLSLRKWPRGSHDQALAEFKRLKYSNSNELVSMAVDDFSPFAAWLPSCAVITPPSGVSSSLGLPHFIGRVAENLAASLSLTFYSLFQERSGRRSSYPRPDKERGELIIKSGVPIKESVVMIIDDVASSGSTLQSAFEFVRGEMPEKCILPVAWIYESGLENDNGLAQSPSSFDSVLSPALSRLIDERYQRIAGLSDLSIAGVKSINDAPSGLGDWHVG